MGESYFQEILRDFGASAPPRCKKFGTPENEKSPLKKTGRQDQANDLHYPPFQTLHILEHDSHGIEWKFGISRQG